MIRPVEANRTVNPQEPQVAPSTRPADAPMSPLSDSPAGMDTYEWRTGRLCRSSRPFAWKKGQSFDDALKSAGFYRHASIEIGYEFDACHLKVHDRLDDSIEPPRYFAEIVVSDVGYLTWIDDLSALLDCLEHLAPMIAAVAVLGDRSLKLDEEREERKAETRERAMWCGQRGLNS